MNERSSSLVPPCSDEKTIHLPSCENPRCPSWTLVARDSANAARASVGVQVEQLHIIEIPAGGVAIGDERDLFRGWREDGERSVRRVVCHRIYVGAALSGLIPARPFRIGLSSSADYFVSGRCPSTSKRFYESTDLQRSSPPPPSWPLWFPSRRVRTHLWAHLNSHRGVGLLNDWPKRHSSARSCSLDGGLPHVALPTRRLGAMSEALRRELRLPRPDRRLSPDPKGRKQALRACATGRGDLDRVVACGKRRERDVGGDPVLTGLVVRSLADRHWNGERPPAPVE